MLKPNRLLRRLPVALLIALAVSAAVGGALAGTDGQEATGPFDDGTVDVPVARLGDQGAYQVTLRGDWDVDFGTAGDAPWSTPWLAMNFSWEDGGAGRDATGAVGPMDRLRVSSRSWDLDIFSDTWSLVERGGSYETRSGESKPYLLRSEGEEMESPELEGNQIPQAVQDAGVPVPQSNQGAGTYYSTGLYREATPDCLLAGAFQGTAVPIDGKVWSRQAWGPDACSLAFLPGGSFYSTTPQWWSNYGSYEDSTWHPLGRQNLGGHEAVGFTMRDPDHWLGGRGIDLWFSEDLPYPLRFVTYPFSVDLPNGTAPGDVRDLDLDTSRSAVFDLTSYVPGAQERLVRGDWTGSWGPWQVVPLRPWGMDETGVDHPFPASQAYHVAKERDVNTTSFLREFPDAYAASAMYSGRGDEHMWEFTLSDGPHILELRVQQAPGEQAAPSLDDPLAPLATPQPVYTFTSQRDDEEEPQSYQRFPDAADAPKEGPSVAQVIARWREAGGTDAATAWGHSITQHWNDDFTAYDATTTFGAGASNIDYVETCVEAVCIPGTQAGWVIHQDYLRTEADGTLASHRVYDLDWNGRYGLVAPHEDPAKAPRSGATSRTEPFWQPTPVQAAGAGAVGILAGLLYVLWPALKAGPAALFSRIEGPKLLDHPVRVRLSLLVSANPGIHFKELRRQSGLANGVLVHHLDKLAASGLVQVKSAGRYRCYFPQNTGAVNGLALAAVKADGAQKVVAAVRSHPGADVRALAEATGLGRSTVHYHLQRLQEAGLVRQAPVPPGMDGGQGATWVAAPA